MRRWLTNSPVVTQLQPGSQVNGGNTIDSTRADFSAKPRDENVRMMHMRSMALILPTYICFQFVGPGAVGNPNGANCHGSLQVVGPRDIPTANVTYEQAVDFCTTAVFLSVARGVKVWSDTRF